MATVSTINTQLMLRVRDPGNLAHDVANVRTLLSYVQQIINAASNAVQTEVSLSFNALTPLNIFDMRHSFPALWRVDRVQYQGQDIEQVDWETLGNIDPYWLRAVGTKPIGWSMIGKRLLALTPTSIKQSQVFTVRGPKILSALTSSSQDLTLPDALFPAMIAMVEALILLRHRLLVSVKPAVEHVDRAIESGTL